MAKNNNNKPESKLTEEEELNALIAKEEQEKIDSSEPKTEIDPKPESKPEVEEIDEAREYKIVILENTKHLVKGKEHIVSGNVAKILTHRGFASIVEIMPAKSKINP